MPKIVLLAARWLAVAMLVLSILLMLARWKFPQKQEPSPSTIAQWKELWRMYRKSRSRENARIRDIKALRRKSVLIVDPDEKSARVLVWRLEGLGCKVHRARNGTMGLSAANKGRGFDVVIADALLPDISAREFYQLLPQNVPVVYVGAVPAQHAELDALGSNVACLAKPFDSEKAVELAGRLLTKAKNLTPSR